MTKIQRNLLRLAIIETLAILSVSSFLACKSFGVWATAEDQKTWNPPCSIRGPQYELACIDDPTIDGAEDACPCHPESLIERLSSPDDAGVKTRPTDRR